MKLLGITKSEITKDKIDENVRHLVLVLILILSISNHVLLVHCNTVNKNY